MTKPICNLFNIRFQSLKSKKTSPEGGQKIETITSPLFEQIQGNAKALQHGPLKEDNKKQPDLLLDFEKMSRKELASWADDHASAHASAHALDSDNAFDQVPYWLNEENPFN